MHCSDVGTPRNIVLAESNTETLDALSRAFEAYGHSVFTARDGLEALRRTEYFTPDAMVVDLGLSELDGYAVAQAIRSQTRFDQTILIASTADLNQTRLGRADEHGFDYFAPKPFDPPLLHEALYAPRQERIVLLSTHMLKQSRELLTSLRSLLHENKALRARSRRLVELVFLLQKSMNSGPG